MKPMTAKGLSRAIGISRRTIFRLKREFPAEAPSFADVAGWRKFALGRVINSEALERLVG
jgi:hypothetical protein